MKNFLALILVSILAVSAHAELKEALSKVPMPPAVAAGEHVSLPQNHDYQKQLRAYMATLKEADFRPDYQDFTVVPLTGDADEKFRVWVLSQAPFAVGLKRNYSSLIVHPALFTIPQIEGATAILRPMAHPEPLIEIADWNYPGNPYFNSRALRLRAFMLTALDMVMLDRLLETADEKTAPNRDQLATRVLCFAYVYPGFRDVIPADACAAYLAGLKKLTRRLLDMGPGFSGGRTQGMYTAAAPALALASQVLADPAITKDSEAFAKRLFTEEKFFHPAGYFPHGGTFDSFNGISTHFALWAACASDWPFARDAMAKVYRLRTHLTLPEPDGLLVGPSHMAALTTADAPHDQWEKPQRSWAAAGIADDAAPFTKMPTGEQIEGGLASAVAHLNWQVHEISTVHGLESAPWKFEPAGMLVNYAYRYYPKGFYARRLALENHDPAKLPVLRDANFIHTFADEFLVAKNPASAVIISTGPITDTSDSDGGFGLGGGALSAFWTKETGSVILGRGVGAWSPRYKKMLDDWRQIPTHAVTGITAEGKVFTSAHIPKPDASTEAKGDQFKIIARGTIPQSRRAEGRLLTGEINYTRQFESAAKGVKITTTLQGDGKDSIAELYEVLPVFLRDTAGQAPAVATTIEFQSAGKWSPATDAYTEKVSAVRLTRFGGAIEVTFDRPRRVKLSLAEWVESYMMQCACRNILIDLLETNDKAAVLTERQSMSYQIQPVAK